MTVMTYNSTKAGLLPPTICMLGKLFAPQPGTTMSTLSKLSASRSMTLLATTRERNARRADENDKENFMMGEKSFERLTKGVGKREISEKKVGWGKAPRHFDGRG